MLWSYQAALRRYLKQGPAANLEPALKLGRLSIAQGMETLDLALIHEQALIALALPIEVPAVRILTVKQAKVFFAEAIVPMEETHRLAQASNVRLNRLNRGLIRRTQEFAASNQRLKIEIARRRAGEKSLRESARQAKRMLAQSQRLQERLSLLSRRILSVQEEERKRISRELHDVIAQMLTGINLRLAALKLEATADAKDLSHKISLTQKLVEKSVDLVHQFARELRPAALDDLGLIPALHAFLKTFTRETGILVSLTAFSGVEQMSSVKRTALYRVAHEALNNVVRHTKAGRVTVSIRRTGDLVLMLIEDDGPALPKERIRSSRKSQRLGLLGMKERMEIVGGIFTFETAPGRGGIVRVQIPFGDKERIKP